MSTDGNTKSSWFGGVDVPKFPALDHDRTCDICIIGAGIAGLSVAYQLVRAGKSVIVIDDSQVGDGQTGRTSAHLASEWDDRYFEAERSVGKEMAKLIYDSHSKAIDSIESIAKAEKIDCDFQRVDGWLFLGPNEKEKILDDELEAAKRAGFEDIEKKSSLKIDGHDFGPALRFGRQAQFHPMRYLVGLARAITEAGGQIFCGDRVIDVQGRDPKTNEDAVTTTQRGVKIVSQHIAVCTNTPAPINDWMGIYLKQASYRTYVVAARMPKGAIAPALYWDTNDPYHYVRVQPASAGKGAGKGADKGAGKVTAAGANHDLLLIGGEDHKTGQAPEHGEPFANLEAWAKERFANLGEIEFRWSGQVQEPDDGVAFIGRAPHKKENVYVCTGDSGMGLTHGTIAGLLISDQILGRTNPWEALYDPSRKQTGALTEFIKENVNVATEYGKYLTGGEVSKADEIEAGSGAIMREGLKKLAVYRDDAGQVHKVSAVCTHLGCIVAWNSVEKTWDCPCHGARYDALGKVVMGPAIDDLSAAE